MNLLQRTLIAATSRSGRLSRVAGNVAARAAIDRIQIHGADGHGLDWSVTAARRIDEREKKRGEQWNGEFVPPEGCVCAGDYAYNFDLGGGVTGVAYQINACTWEGISSDGCPVSFGCGLYTPGLWFGIWSYFDGVSECTAEAGNKNDQSFGPQGAYTDPVTLNFMTVLTI